MQAAKGRAACLKASLQVPHTPSVRYSQLFPKTLKAVPKGVTSAGYQLLYRGGYVRTLGKGLMTLMPLGLRVIRRLEDLFRKELAELGGQEVLAPIVNPKEIWKKSGRHTLTAGDLVEFTDRLGREMVLASTHEEAIVEMVRMGIHSYRDLPLFLYQFQEKYRDEERVRYGLLRSREFIMKDGYSFHRSFSDLNNFFPKVFRAYHRIFAACELDVVVAEAGVGYMGGEKSYEFLVASPIGDEHLIVCDRCGYAANRDVAVNTAEIGSGRSGRPREMKKIETPGCNTMSTLAEHLDLPRSSLAKTMVFASGDNELVMAVVRGDSDVSEEKLSRLIGANVLRQARGEEMVEFGLVPGYVSPLGIVGEITVVVDRLAADSANLVYGGNSDGVHFADVNFGRDFDADAVGDIARAASTGACVHCGGALYEQRALELGNLFRLGTRYSRSMDLTFTDEHGRVVHPYMGSYGVGMGRLVAAIAEEHRDEDGLIWPVSVAPFHVYLMTIGKSFTVKQTAEAIKKDFGEMVLLDDREESISTKFKDFLLLGIPLRVIVSSATVADGTVELYDRRSGKAEKVPVGSVRSFVEARLEVLSAWRSS